MSKWEEMYLVDTHFYQLLKDLKTLESELWRKDENHDCVNVMICNIIKLSDP